MRRIFTYKYAVPTFNRFTIFGDQSAQKLEVLCDANEKEGPACHKDVRMKSPAAQILTPSECREGLAEETYLKGLLCKYFNKKRHTSKDSRKPTDQE